MGATRHRRAAAPLREAAPAKINLTLRVISRARSGYHRIESLVTFADVGERVEARVSDRVRLDVAGPMAARLGVGANLILAADSAFREAFPETPPLAYRLDKHIPVAAGLGGGSADAAAALRLLAGISGKSAHEAAIAAIAPAIGADVPVCVGSEPALVTGIGEQVTRLANMPRFALVLVNPGIGLATERVFQALGLEPGQRAGGPAPAPPADQRPALERAVISGANDLESAARGLAPEIGAVLDDIGRTQGCLARRMSGSGATCFGIFADMEAAGRAARALARSQPGWWVRPALSGGLGSFRVSASG